MKKLVGVLAIPLIAGCVTTPQIEVGPTPTCAGESDCAVKWAAARTFVLAHAGMKIQNYSSDFLETYNSSDMSVAARVNKEPIAGGYAITATFWCGNIFGCNENPRGLLAAFNAQVAAARQ